MKRVLILLTCMICIFSTLALSAQDVYAASDPSRLTLYYYDSDEDIPLSGATFYLYLVAVPDGNGGYTVLSDFEDYKVDLSDLDWEEAGRLAALAGTLSAYTARDGISPLKTEKTDPNGYLTFDDLEAGLYLIRGDQLTVNIGSDKWLYSPQPILIPMPYPTMDKHGNHDVETEVKYERDLQPDQEEHISITVKKVWQGSGEHPASVVAQLLKNGLVIDEVELNSLNNWQYTWLDLNKGYVWQVVEKEIPIGYTVTVTQDGYVFTITNKKTPDTPVDDPPGQWGDNIDDDPTEDPTDEPRDDPQEEDKLPQTGQLWWPVPFMLIVGILMLGFGIVLRRNG